MMWFLLLAAVIALGALAREDVRTRLVSLRLLLVLVFVRVLLMAAVCLSGLEGGGSGGEAALLSSGTLPSWRVCLGAAFVWPWPDAGGLLFAMFSAGALAKSLVCAVAVVLFLKIAETFVRGIQQVCQRFRFSFCASAKDKGFCKTETPVCLYVSKEPQESKPASSNNTQHFLGAGDVWLMGVCCLFLTPYQAALFLVLAFLLGLLTAGYYVLRYHDGTFPFVPAIALGCCLAFCL